MAAAGVSGLGGSIAGTQALRLSEGELGVRFSFEVAAQTGDIDIAGFERLSVAIEGIISFRSRRLRP